MASSNTKNSLLADQARALFAERVTRVLPELGKASQERLTALIDEPGSTRQMQERRDARMAFEKGRQTWLRGTADAWAKARMVPSAGGGLTTLGLSTGSKFELMGKDAMEDKILSSRLALRLLDFSSWELNDLRLRVQTLESIPELNKQDIFRPEVLAHHLIDQWLRAPIPRDVWLVVQDIVQKMMGESLHQIYHDTNEFLVQRGVMAEIDLRPLVRRTPSGVNGQANAADVQADAEQDSEYPAERQGNGRPGGYPGQRADPRDQAPGRNQGRAPMARNAGGPEGGPSRLDRFRGSAPEGRGRPPSEGGQAQAGAGSDRAGLSNQVYEETRMQTATTPLARARMRAQGVMGQLKRLLTNQVAGFDDTRAANASPGLVQAMVNAERVEEEEVQRTLLADAHGQVYGQGEVEQAMGSLRERTKTLKNAAATSAEKATIEIVALMFQSILAEERIPAMVRVWFARLQMPVLRLAISEPEFFGSLQHPARRLIDRMGSCVLGFDVTVSGGALELEIKRIVQVIEQYPETGRRVFQLVYDEFDKFLSKFLSERGSIARVVSVAQQVEQKETMAVQYTIEMRNMLNDMPVREEIRDFLFKTWAEVLAIAAVKNGPQHEQTLTLKKAASDLVWAASAKPNRVDRARVIADLPKLLQLLRLGMSMLGLEMADQDAHLKIISDTLADAFMSKTAVISLERIEVMAKRLTNLEDYLSDEDVGDLPLDIETLVTMIGIDAADIQIIVDGGSQPTEAMRAWAQELQLGAWFSLDHNGKVSHVQFAWCSERKQLHLFASADGRTFLIQARRLAAYLQAGLLVPTEEEALTVRATRDALAKLDANPERLLD